MQEIFAALISFFILEPLEGELRTQLARAGIAQQRIGQVVSCLQTEGPGVVDRAVGNPVWAFSTAVGIWTGMTSPQEALSDAAPKCAAEVSSGAA